MSTQAAPMPLDSLMPDFEAPARAEVGNACPRRWTALHSAKVFSWEPGEVTQVEEIRGPRLDKWGVPEQIPKSVFEIVDGKKRIPSHMLVTKQGCSLQDILKHLFNSDGCPLYVLKNDGRDPERRRMALERWRAWRLPKAQQEVEDNRLRAAREYSMGLPATSKPPGVREAEADLEMFRRTIDITNGRYMVRKDNEVFDFYDDAEAYIRKNFPEVADVWQSWVTDRVGGTPVFRGSAEAPAAPAPEPVPRATESGRSLGAAEQGIIAMADQFGKVLPEELVARLGSDPGAVKEAMDIILAPEPKRRGRPPGSRNAPESDVQDEG